MSEERLQEIKDSINFQYELIVSKGIDRSALLFTDEEQELLEEVERLNKENEHLRTALNSKESIIKEAIEYIKEKYIEDYSNNDNYIPLEKLNLKNCNWERSLQVLEILGRVEEE